MARGRTRASWYGLPCGEYLYDKPAGTNKYLFYARDNSDGDCGVFWWHTNNGWTEIQGGPEQIPVEIADKLRAQYGFTYKNEEEEARLMSIVSKLLSSGLLVSSSDFAKLAPAKQTEVLASAAGKPIVFVDNFASLRNKRNLVARLVNGEDCTTELEFNDITLSKDEAKVLEALRPIIERIRGASGKYPWIVRTADQETYCKNNIRFDNGYGGERVVRCGYEMTVKQAKRVWDAASNFWATGEAPEKVSGEYGGYRKTVVFKEDYIEVGCQKINRHEVEYIAEHFGWEPNVEEKAK